MPTRKNWRTICIVGNIATGKSTLVTLLADSVANSVAIPESFEENPFLQLYMRDKPRWAFTNAVRYLYDYVRVYRNLTSGHAYDYQFIDAGVPTNRQVYGKYLADRGILTPAENDFYNVLGDVLTRAYAYPEPDAYIFVEASPDTCFRRMQERGWNYQTENVGMDYLLALDDYFRAFRDMLQTQESPLFVLDTDRIDLETEDGKREAVERIRGFLEGGSSAE